MKAENKSNQAVNKPNQAFSSQNQRYTRLNDQSGYSVFKERSGKAIRDKKKATLVAFRVDELI
jgi:hypothetical protein